MKEARTVLSAVGSEFVEFDTVERAAAWAREATRTLESTVPYFTNYKISVGAEDVCHLTCR